MSPLRDEFARRIRAAATPHAIMAALYEEASPELERLATELAEAVSAHLKAIDTMLDAANTALTNTKFVEATRAIEDAKRLLINL